MNTKLSLFVAAGLCAALSMACKKDDAKSEPAAEAPTAEKPAEAEAAAEAPSFEIEAERVVVVDALAPNETYKEQGLGLEAKEGNVFVCAFYSITNAGKAPEMGQMPKLVAADGTEYEVSVEAAGKLPSDWASTLASGDIAPGASQSGPRCYEVPAAAAEGALKLHFVDTGNMSGEGAWEETVELPAPAAEGEEAAAEGEEAAAEGEEAAAEGEEAAAEPTE